jgi:hypothetical protein
MTTQIVTAGIGDVAIDDSTVEASGSGDMNTLGSVAIAVEGATLVAA